MHLARVNIVLIISSNLMCCHLILLDLNFCFHKFFTLHFAALDGIL
jgi:hypothetical protein